ncbi:hypothetical protein [Mycoplasma sp. E35C]|uniref:hypothetical protein n=1 Tax=Mycoplasma sp. E35C TaxID=2801918 RepID=UPI001CA4355E|nr:hypothetical protein [Mycoplasma sp. E35C]QZX49113.1 hypothetical protein JJE79_03615 [Mycoplasma sp. E35C]
MKTFFKNKKLVTLFIIYLVIAISTSIAFALVVTKYPNEYKFNYNFMLITPLITFVVLLIIYLAVIFSDKSDGFIDLDPKLYVNNKKVLKSVEITHFITSLLIGLSVITMLVFLFTFNPRSADKINTSTNTKINEDLLISLSVHLAWWNLFFFVVMINLSLTYLKATLYSKRKKSLSLLSFSTWSLIKEAKQVINVNLVS